jgi:hypothetical protein
MKSLSCPNRRCSRSRKSAAGSIIRHGFYKTGFAGRPSARTPAHLRNVSSRMNLKQNPLIVTDGFEFYEKVVGRVFGPASLYGQVLKTRRNDQIVKVERRIVLGGAWRLEQALRDSEDSVKLNAESDDPTGLSLSWSPNDLSSPVEGTSRRSPRDVRLLLQLHRTSQSTQIRT